jgi:hypothetical protein
MSELMAFDGLGEFEYNLARLRIDMLCSKIEQKLISIDKARQEYFNIEQKYVTSNRDKADLFIMIYRSRIERLCGQFLSEGD